MRINEKKLDVYPPGYDFRNKYINITPRSLLRQGSNVFVYSYQTGRLSSAPYPTTWHELLSLQGVKKGGMPGTDVTQAPHMQNADGWYSAFGENNRLPTTPGIQIDWELLKYYVVGACGKLGDHLCIAVFNATENLEDCFTKLIKKYPEFGQNPEEVVVKPGHWTPMPLSEFFAKTKHPAFDDDYLDHTLNFKDWLLATEGKKDEKQRRSRSRTGKTHHLFNW